MSERTKGRLTVDHTLVWTESGALIAAAEWAAVDTDTAHANAEFIARAWNAHDDLLAACKECLAACNRWDFAASPAAIGICISKLEAAIAKAEPESNTRQSISTGAEQATPEHPV